MAEEYKRNKAEFEKKLVEVSKEKNYYQNLVL